MPAPHRRHWIVVASASAARLQGVQNVVVRQRVQHQLKELEILPHLVIRPGNADCPRPTWFTLHVSGMLSNSRSLQHMTATNTRKFAHILLKLLELRRIPGAGTRGVEIATTVGKLPKTARATGVSEEF